MVVVSPERAEDNLLKGAMPCPRCQGVLRPFGTGRTRTVRGVGADTVTVTPRRARCADCSSDPDPAADRAGGAAGRQHRSDRKRLGRQRSRRRVPNHRRPVRAARVDGPPMVASRPGAARAVNVPAGRGPGRADRPGDAGPAGAAADNPRARVEPARRRGRAVPGLLRQHRPGLVADRFLRSRAAPGGAAATS